MTVQELMDELELRPPDAEVLLDNSAVAVPITRVEDDSQGVYLVADTMATDRGEW